MDWYLVEHIVSYLPFDRQLVSRGVNHERYTLVSNLCYGSMCVSDLVQETFVWILKYGLLNGERKLVEYALNKVKYDIDKFLYWAYRGGFDELIDMIERYGNIVSPSDYCFYGACRGGHMKLVERTLDLSCVDNGIIEACHGGHQKVVEFLQSSHACRGGHKDLFGTDVSLLS
jgi:hypothetical protein